MGAEGGRLTGRGTPVPARRTAPAVLRRDGAQRRHAPAFKRNLHLGKSRHHLRTDEVSARGRGARTRRLAKQGMPGRRSRRRRTLALPTRNLRFGASLRQNKSSRGARNKRLQPETRLPRLRAGGAQTQSRRRAQPAKQGCRVSRPCRGFGARSPKNISARDHRLVSVCPAACAKTRGAVRCVSGRKAKAARAPAGSPAGSRRSSAVPGGVRRCPVPSGLRSGCRRGRRGPR